MNGFHLFSFLSSLSPLPFSCCLVVLVLVLHELPENRTLCQDKAPLILLFITSKLFKGKTYVGTEGCSFRSLHYYSSEAETHRRVYM